jgi:hypothetical protein
MSFSPISLSTSLGQQYNKGKKKKRKKRGKRKEEEES